MENSNTIIVVPCYNESQRLDGEAFLRFADENEGIRFLFVNDGSRDNTLEVLNALAQRHPRMLVLDLEQNGGKA